MKQDSKRPKPSYHRLPSEVKKTLIRLICLEGYKIKHAAKQLNIKYAAAKSIFLYFRNNMIKSKQSLHATKRCFYRIKTDEKINFRIITKIAGEFVNSKTQLQTQPQILI